MSKILDELVAEHRTLVEANQTMVEAAAEERRDLSDTEKSSFQDTERRAAVLADQIERIVGREKASRRIADMVHGLDRVETREQARTPQRETRSLGEMFADSDELRSWGGRGSSMAVELETRTLLTTTDPAGLTIATTVGGYVPPTRTPLYDAIAKIPVTTNAVEYPIFTPEWVAQEVAEAAEKPEAGTFTLANKTLKKWAHWKKMSREFRQDRAYLAALVDQQLVAGVRRAAEKSAVTAVTGTGTTKVTGSSLQEAVRLGIGKVEAAGGMATSIVIHPEDSAAVDVAALGQAGGCCRDNHWGLQVIAAPGATKGTAVVFDVDAVVAYVRTGIETFMTDSDISGEGSTAKSDFRYNILTVVAEARGLVVLQTPALAVPVGTA